MLASMRPGQTAPECVGGGRHDGATLVAFNEAGADCPGMPGGRPRRARFHGIPSMRPGQAAPECPVSFGGSSADLLPSMRPGQTAPECRLNGLGWFGGKGASMRPGQTAPS